MTRINQSVVVALVICVLSIGLAAAETVSGSSKQETSSDGGKRMRNTDPNTDSSKKQMRNTDPNIDSSKKQMRNTNPDFDSDKKVMKNN